MRCERCQGLMFEDHFMDMNDLSEGMWVSTWRCMNCGHAVDPVMVANRQRQAAWGVREEHIAQEVIDRLLTVAA